MGVRELWREAAALGRAGCAQGPRMFLRGPGCPEGLDALMENLVAFPLRGSSAWGGLGALKEILVPWGDDFTLGVRMPWGFGCSGGPDGLQEILVP